MTTETATATRLGDLAAARIKSITWIALGADKPHFIRDQHDIDEWVRLYASAPIEMLDGNWCNVEPRHPYLSFEVFLKP